MTISNIVLDLNNFLNDCALWILRSFPSFALLLLTYEAARLFIRNCVKFLMFREEAQTLNYFSKFVLRLKTIQGLLIDMTSTFSFLLSLHFLFTSVNKASWRINISSDRFNFRWGGVLKRHEVSLTQNCH